MTDAKWTFTAPKKDETCWTDLKVFTDKDCKTAGDAKTVVATMKVEGEDKTLGWKLTTCGEKELVVGTGADYKTEVKVDVSGQKEGKIACGAWDKVFVSMTLFGVVDLNNPYKFEWFYW